MRINSDATRNFIYATAAVLIFIAGASALIGWDSFEADRDNHRNMQEGQTP